MDTKLCAFLVWMTVPFYLISAYEEYFYLLRPKNLTVTMVNRTLLLSWNCNIPKEILSNTSFKIFEKDYESWNKESLYKVDSNIRQQNLPLQLEADLKVMTVLNGRENDNMSEVISFKDQGLNGTKAENLSCKLQNITMSCTWAFGKNAPEDTVYSLYLQQDDEEIKCQNSAINKNRRVECIFQNLKIKYFEDARFIIEGTSKEKIQLFIDIFSPAKAELFNPPLITNYSTQTIIDLKWRQPYTVYNAAKTCFEYEIQINTTKLKSYTVNGWNELNISRPSSKEKCLINIRARGIDSCTMSTQWGQWSNTVSCDKDVEESMVTEVMLFSFVATGIIAVMVILLLLCIRFKILSILFPSIPQPKQKFRNIDHCGSNQMCKCIERIEIPIMHGIE
ncbi:granulocyte-macrophage colony-stimulating factor receptor subunit alpha [Bombina bombina]|uniref:granulocyte-macrophage colony-stimulating factor receptor subunit alpha n=1 Tax=Bombina bombina TaxID=8345 RepID=UPI00235AB931|nr:granulocyte-macrophage colony-stimulating factor receptor subunit alpha [Bombina bombina]